MEPILSNEFVFVENSPNIFCRSTQKELLSHKKKIEQSQLLTSRKIVTIDRKCYYNSLLDSAVNNSYLTIYTYTESFLSKFTI